MNPMVRALVCRVGKAPVVEEVEDRLKHWKALVGGWLQLAGLGNGVVLVCNEEAPRLGMPFNREVLCRAKPLTPGDITVLWLVINSGTAPTVLTKHRVYGDFALVRTGAGGFASLKDADICKYKPLLGGATTDPSKADDGSVRLRRRLRKDLIGCERSD